MRRIDDIVFALGQASGYLPSLALPPLPAELEPPAKPRWKPPRVVLPPQFVALDEGRLTIREAIDLMQVAPDMVPPEFAARFRYESERAKERFQRFEQARVAKIRAYEQQLEEGYDEGDTDVITIARRIATISVCTAHQSDAAPLTRRRRPQPPLPPWTAPGRFRGPYDLSTARRRWAEALQVFKSAKHRWARTLDIPDVDDMFGFITCLNPGLLAARLLSERFPETYESLKIDARPATAAQLVSVMRVFLSCCSMRWFPFTGHYELLEWGDDTHRRGEYDFEKIITPDADEAGARTLLREYSYGLLEGETIPLWIDSETLDSIEDDGEKLGLVFLWHVAIQTQAAFTPVDMGELFDAFARKIDDGAYPADHAAVAQRIPMAPQLPAQTPVQRLVDRLLAKGKAPFDVDLGAALQYALHLNPGDTWFLQVSDMDVREGGADAMVDLTESVQFLDDLATDWRLAEYVFDQFWALNHLLYREPDKIDAIARYLVEEAYIAIGEQEAEATAAPVETPEDAQDDEGEDQDG